jgi:hypothetical protein
LNVFPLFSGEYSVGIGDMLADQPYALGLITQLVALNWRSYWLWYGAFNDGPVL